MNEEFNLLSSLEKYLCKIDDEKFLIQIQGVNPIYKEIREHLIREGGIMEYFIWGEYIFDRIKLSHLMKNNWKGGLEENEHFYHITTTSELDFFIESLRDKPNETNEISRIYNFLKSDLNSEGKEEAIKLILSAKNSKSTEKYQIMKKTKKYIKSINDLNTVFNVNKNFYATYKKKEKEDKNGY